MASPCSGSQDSKPYQPHVYKEDKEIPFAPDGNAPLICAYIEKVKGISSRYWGIKCVRKNVVVPFGTDGVSQSLLKRKLVQEAKILHLARHFHVIELIHTYFEQVDGNELKYAVIMDRADANLRTYLKPGKIPAPQWFGCLISVVHHIHTLGIRHRDIKPSNILVKEGRILLADFGISQMGIGKTMPTTYQYRKVSRSPEYCAPEVDRGSTRGRSADIFSLGAVFLEMLVALNASEHSAELSSVLKPSSESTASYAKHIDGVHKWIQGNFHPVGWQADFLYICRRMLDPHRDSRPSAESIKYAWSSLALPDTLITCNHTGDLIPTKTERLIAACKIGSEDDVKSLLDQGAEPVNSEAIHYAAAGGSVVTVQALLNAGVHVDNRSLVGQTALQCAARSGSVEVVQQLLNNHADVNAKDENEQTALHGAAAQGYDSIVRMLLEAKADISTEDLDGQTALQFAVRRHHTVVQALLESFSNRNSQMRD